MFEFQKTSELAGTGTLYCDGPLLDRVEMHDLWPLNPRPGNLYCGYDDGSPISDRYSCPHPFTGTIHQVVVEVGTDHVPDHAREDHAMLSED